MSAKVFLDTNVWIYAATGREDYPSRYARACELIAQEDLGVSTQVIGEFLNVARKGKKMLQALPVETTEEWVRQMLVFPLIEVDRQIVLRAFAISEQSRIGYWDSQMLACAERFGASVLYSEDLSDGQAYGSVRCQNPFKEH